MHRHELNDAEWNRLEPLLPPEKGRRGRPTELPNRTFLNAIFYIAKTGVPWRDLPERFGPWKTVHNRFTRWNQRGVLQKVLDEFKKDADHESNMADGSYAKAHQDSAGGKGGPKRSVLDALAEVLPPKSTLSWTLSVTRSTSILRPATSTTSQRPPSSSSKPKERTSSPTKAMTPTKSSKRSSRRP